MSYLKTTKKQASQRLGVLKTMMDLRRLFIKTERDVIKSCQKSIKENTKEFLDFKKEYMRVLKDYYGLE